MLLGRPVQFLNPLHGDGAGLDQDGSRRGAQYGLAPAQPHVPADDDIGQHADDYVGGCRGLAGRFGHLGSAIRQCFCLVRGPIPDGEWIACVQQAGRHA